MVGPDGNILKDCTLNEITVTDLGILVLIWKSFEKIHTCDLMAHTPPLRKRAGEENVLWIANHS